MSPKILHVPGIVGIDVQRHTADHSDDSGFMQHLGTDTWTVTLTGNLPQGAAEVVATASGPDGEAVAGWFAFQRLMRLDAHVRREEWHRLPSGEWQMEGAVLVRPDDGSDPVRQLFAPTGPGEAATDPGEETSGGRRIRAEVNAAVARAFGRLGDKLIPVLSPNVGESVDKPFRRALYVIREWVEEEGGTAGEAQEPTA